MMEERLFQGDARDVQEEHQTKTQPQKPDENKYAHIFAQWDLLPPQVMVRRVRHTQE